MALRHIAREYQGFGYDPGAGTVSPVRFASTPLTVLPAIHLAARGG